MDWKLVIATMAGTPFWSEAPTGAPFQPNGDNYPERLPQSALTGQLTCACPCHFQWKLSPPYCLKADHPLVAENSRGRKRTSADVRLRKSSVDIMFVFEHIMARRW